MTRDKSVSPSCGLLIAGVLLLSLVETGDRMGLITEEEAARPADRHSHELGQNIWHCGKTTNVPL